MLPISYKCQCGYVSYGINFDEIMANLEHKSDGLTCIFYLQTKHGMVK